MKVCIWPDGEWCEFEELEQFQKDSNRSDDFQTVEVPPIINDVDLFVQRHLEGLHCTKPMPKWEIIKQIHGGHKIFLDKMSGRHAIADYSGPTPDKTTDGILWIDVEAPLVHTEGKWGVPVLKDDGTKASTLANDDEAKWLLENLKMAIMIGGDLFRPFKKIPMIPRKDGVGDVSTRHITRNDSECLQSEVVPRQIGKFEYGYVVLTHPRQETRMTALIKDAGMSDAYVTLLNIAYDLGYHYLMIDQDAPEVEGLETFDW